MGLRGNATCVMSYGEEDSCYGWLLGAPPDEKGKGSGLALMFRMMNGSRLGTGLMGMAEATAAYYFAAQYTAERIAGFALSNPKGGRVPTGNSLKRLAQWITPIIFASYQIGVPTL